VQQDLSFFFFELLAPRVPKCEVHAIFIYCLLEYEVHACLCLLLLLFGLVVLASPLIRLVCACFSSYSACLCLLLLLFGLFVLASPLIRLGCACFSSYSACLCLLLLLFGLFVLASPHLYQLNNILRVQGSSPRRTYTATVALVTIT